VLQIAGDAHVGDRDEAEARIPQPLLQPARDDLLDALCHLAGPRIAHALILPPLDPASARQ